VSCHEALESVASRCRDTITGSLLVDPVVAEDGHTYERRAILEWFRRRVPATSPMTHEVIGTKVKANYAIRAIVEDLVTSHGALPDLERAEWHLARGKMLCEKGHRRGADSVPRGHQREDPPPNNSVRFLASEIRRIASQHPHQETTTTTLAAAARHHASLSNGLSDSAPDVRAARQAFAKAEQLLAEKEDATCEKVHEECVFCRDLCDLFLDLERKRDQAKQHAVDLEWAKSAYDAVFQVPGTRLTMFQKLSRGTRVRVLNDRRLVLDAFLAQEDVLSLPSDWEASLGQVFIVENYDLYDFTYVVVPGDRFHHHEDNTKVGTWWPFSALALLP